MGRLMVLEQQMDAQAASKVGKGPAGAAVLMRGMRRRTWTGPAWLSLTDGSQVPAWSPSRLAFHVSVSINPHRHVHMHR